MWRYLSITIIIFTPRTLCTDLKYNGNCSVEHNAANQWSVDCSMLNLDYFPKNILKYPIRNLTFVKNNLNSSIKFNFWDLQYLNIAYNNINYIKNDTFIGLENLKYLNLSFNNIKLLKSEVFDELNSLKILDLSGNKDLGRNTTNLEISISQVLYKGLKKLYISNMEIYELKDDFFDRAIELILLDLSNNHLKYLPLLPKTLKILDISNNSFIMITFKPFYYSRSIYTIIAENNRNLTEVQSDTFHGMSDLKYVSFKDCIKLNTIYYGTFHFNENLEYLSIANCNFTTLPQFLKPIMFRTYVLDLQGNPWHCTPSLKWFYLLDIPTNMTENLRCAQPSDVPLLEFYGPKHHHEILRVILGVLVIFVFVFFGVGLFFAYEMERKRKLAHPYIPLGSGRHVPSPVYVSTVV